MAAALLFTLPPFFDSLAIWVPWLFLVSLGLKFWMEPRGYRLRSVVLKLLLVATALTTAFISYGSVRGVEGSISLLVVLMSLKILEAHTAREFRVMVLIGWMLCLCGFFLSQDFGTALCLLIAFALLVVALVQFHRGASPSAVWPPVGTTCKLLLQASPLVVLFFLLFPRINAGFRFELRPFRSANTGFSDQLSPGSIAALANSSEIAFRAGFPGSSTPPSGPMYWRGLVMSRCNGMEWRAPYTPRSKSPPSTFDVEGSGAVPAQSSNATEIQQRITLAPHGARWMFALDRPIKAPSGAMLARGDYLSSVQPIRKARRYDVVSSEFNRNEITAIERAEALEVPASISPAVRDLARSWTVQNPDSRGVVNSALQFFRTQGFLYSLTPGDYDGLEEFLFRRRVGFCEHYAASFATLMRLAGIPARVVVGYLGGEYNDLGHFFLVRQSDAHAWCEVWLPEKGWTRVDPTSAVAPGRSSLDLTSFLETRVASGQIGTRRNVLIARLLRSGVFTNARFIWQTLSYEWDTRLLAFDADVQDVLLTSMGIASRAPFSLVVEILLVAIALLAIYFAWMQLRACSRVDRVKALYNYFCRKTASLGVPRDPCEGPLDFARRAAQSLPNESSRIRQIADTYILLRYAPRPVPGMLETFAKEVNAFGARTRHWRHNDRRSRRSQSQSLTDLNRRPP
jgi:transglutaminase-like putative cysteine protease